MDTLLLTVSMYGLTIVFALLIAAALHGLGILIKKLNLDPEPEPMDLSMPSSDAEKEQEAIAVAIAAAHATRMGRLPSKRN